MWVRGAPLIGAVGAYGLALALDRDASDAALAERACGARRDAAHRRQPALGARPRPRRSRAAAASANAPTPRGARPTPSRAEDVAINHAIGVHGLDAAARHRARAEPARCNVMTHCNAGALATCGWGTATAPLFLAHAEGLPVHVWVSETRPRLQGANLTAWELAPARRAAHAVRRRARAAS